MGTCAAAQNPAAAYDLKATPGTVHRGFFDASLKVEMIHKSCTIPIKNRPTFR
jgi:hypothetical protein